MTSRLRRWALDAFSVDLRALAALRIGLALLILVDLSQRAGDLTAHYTDSGVLPRSAYVFFFGAPEPLALHAWGGSASYEGTLFGLAALLACALLLGYHSRLAALGSWLLLLSLHQRNPLVMHAGDNLLRLLTFWSAFLPIGACCSLDAKREPLAPGTPRQGASLATAALLLQPMIVYLSTGYLKAGIPDWFDGLALYDALTGYWARPAAAALLDYPRLLMPLSLGVIGFELAGPLLLLTPSRRDALRRCAAAAFTLMQISFGACLYVGLFPFISTLALLPFFRPRNAAAPQAAETGRFELTTGMRIVAAGALALLLLNEVDQITGLRLPKAVLSLSSSVGLRTPWTMFTAPAAHESRVAWLGTLKDGTEVDLMSGLPQAAEGPAGTAAEPRNMRWAKFHYETLMPVYKNLYPDMLRYEVRRWDAAHPGSPLATAVVGHFWRPIRPIYQEMPYKFKQLARYNASGLARR